MQKQFAPHHLALGVVTHVDQHGHEAARMIKVDRPVIAHLPLMDIHSDPQSMWFMFNLSQRRPLFVDAVFTIGDVMSIGQFDPTTLVIPDRRELLLTPVNKMLTVKSIEECSPSGLFVKQAFVTFIAPIE